MKIMKTFFSAISPVVAVFALIMPQLAPAAQARSAARPASPCEQVVMGEAVELALGKSTLLKPASPVVRLLLGNPNNVQAGKPEESEKADDKAPARSTASNGMAQVDVLLLGPSEIFLLGKTPGSTNLVLQGRDGVCTMLDVRVGLDTGALGAALKKLLPGASGVQITSAGDSLVLSGTVSDALMVERVMDIAGAYIRAAAGNSRGAASERIINMLEVEAPQQVMLEVKVAEISKALLDKFGTDISGSLRLRSLFELLNIDVSGTRVISFGNASGVTASGSLSTPLSRGELKSNLSVDMEKQDGLIKVLAEPNVMAISGQEGSFLAGGKIFIPVQSNNSNGGTSVTLEEKEFGVSLRFTPTVLAGGRINLKVNPEVSELSSRGVTLTAAGVSGATILPSFTTRRAATTVQLRDGQSFAIGGLIKNNESSSITAFPFLGELPVIGALFRSTSFQTDRTELVFVITPRLVKPLPPDYPLPTDSYVPPSRYDMIINGRLEGSAQDQPAPAAPAPAQQPGGFEVK